ncbi:transcriptional regulator [Salmonella enterica subsp. diarizonae]|nr:transcriptional regulator [Salmonella enterica subsp. diarizonae]
MTCDIPRYDDHNEAGVSLAWKAQQLIRTRYHLPLQRRYWRKRCIVMQIILGVFTVASSI